MSEHNALAKEIRNTAKKKVERLVSPGKGQMVSAATWSPEPEMHTERKTGKQPISPSHYGENCNDGDGGTTLKRGDRIARKSGGRTNYAKGGSTDVELTNERKNSLGHRFDVEKNGNRLGTIEKHSSGFSAYTPDLQNRKRFSSKSDAISHLQSFSDDGKRNPRASGGRTKGKTNINIVIAQPGAGKPDTGGDQLPASMQRPAPPMGQPVPPANPPAAMAGMPPGAVPQGMMDRKEGGRTVMPRKMTAGAASGEGRLEKTENAKKDR